jgi:hypothetical protein
MLLVGGVECSVDHVEVALGHIIVPVRDIVAFGVSRIPAQVVVIYERRAAERGYRDPRAGKPSTVTVDLTGDYESLITLLRQRAPDKWRGHRDAPSEIAGEPIPLPQPEPPRPLRVFARLVRVVSLVLLGLLLLFVLVVGAAKLFGPKVSQAGSHDGAELRN